jgi:hypothetical protein
MALCPAFDFWLKCRLIDKRFFGCGDHSIKYNVTITR